jgi:hypothetical protein
MTGAGGGMDKGEVGAISEFRGVKEALLLNASWRDRRESVETIDIVLLECEPCDSELRRRADALALDRPPPFFFLYSLNISWATLCKRTFNVDMSRYASREEADRYRRSDSFLALYGSWLVHSSDCGLGFRLRNKVALESIQKEN